MARPYARPSQMDLAGSMPGLMAQRRPHAVTLLRYANNAPLQHELRGAASCSISPHETAKIASHAQGVAVNEARKPIGVARPLRWAVNTWAIGVVSPAAWASCALDWAERRGAMIFRACPRCRR